MSLEVRKREIWGYLKFNGKGWLIVCSSFSLSVFIFIFVFILNFFFFYFEITTQPSTQNWRKQWEYILRNRFPHYILLQLQRPVMPHGCLHWFRRKVIRQHPCLTAQRGKLNVSETLIVVGSVWWWICKHESSNKSALCWGTKAEKAKLNASKEGFGSVLTNLA